MKRLLLLLLCLLGTKAFAVSNSAMLELSFTIPSYLRIEPLTSTVLTANLRNDYVLNPLYVRYKVISNIPETTLYLTSKSLVDGSYEHSMFAHGGSTYIVFTSVDGRASLQNLTEAKYNLKALNTLVLPILSVTGAEHKFLHDKYELYIKNGSHYIDVHIGLSPVVRGNKNGMYQATIYLTKSEI